MKKIILIVLTALSLSATAMAASAMADGGCFLKYSYVSGMNKICVYSCIGGERAVTVSAVELCPLSI